MLGAEGCALGSQMCIGTSPALVPKPSQRQDEDGVLGEGGELTGGVPEHVEREAPGLEVEDEKCGRDERGADMRHDKVSDPRLEVGRLLVVVDDQKERGKRHELPEQQEREHVVRGCHQDHRQDEDVEQQPEGLAAVPSARRAAVAQRVDGYGCRDEPDNQHEEGGDAVDVERDPD